MLKSLARKWVKALRSNKYRQGEGKLLQINREQTKYYCCLGVLGDVCGLTTEDMNDEEVLDGNLGEVTGIADAEGIPQTTDINVDGYEDAPTHPVKVRVGNTYKEFKSLADANDSGASFRSITSWIERNYKSL